MLALLELGDLGTTFLLLFTGVAVLVGVTTFVGLCVGVDGLVYVLLVVVLLGRVPDIEEYCCEFL